MLLKKVLFGFLVIGGMYACNSGKPSVDGKHYGTEITADGAITYDDMLTKIGQSDSLGAKVQGKVVSVCKAKGCWMTIASDDPSKPEMMVTFKDYGFFMPKDLAGKTVVMEGYAYHEVTSVADLKHFAEDEKLPQAEIDKITEPKEELKFMAHGVLIK